MIPLALYGPISGIVERIQQLPAHTLAGAQAKAAVPPSSELSRYDGRRIS